NKPAVQSDPAEAAVTAEKPAPTEASAANQIVTPVAEKTPDPKQAAAPVVVAKHSEVAVAVAVGIAAAPKAPVAGAPAAVQAATPVKPVEHKAVVVKPSAPVQANDSAAVAVAPVQKPVA